MPNLIESKFSIVLKVTSSTGEEFPVDHISKAITTWEDTSFSDQCDEDGELSLDEDSEAEEADHCEGCDEREETTEASEVNGELDLYLDLTSEAFNQWANLPLLYETDVTITYLDNFGLPVFKHFYIGGKCLTLTHSSGCREYLDTGVPAQSGVNCMRQSEDCLKIKMSMGYTESAQFIRTQFIRV